MAINQQTLAAAKSYTDTQLSEHTQANDPHPQYARLLDVAGNVLPGGNIILARAGDSFPPVAANSILISPGGIFIPNETVTAWVQLGQGPIPSDTTPPTMPQNFRVTATTTTSITVAWDASTDLETGVGGYDVAADSGAFIALGAVTTYTFTGLTPSTSYALKVRARDNATTPNLSTEATVAATTQAVPVSSPRNLRNTDAATTTLTFAWDPPASGTVARYETRIGNGAFTSNGTATTKLVTGLTQDTPYTFGVRAVATDGTTSAEVTTTARTTATSGNTTDILIGLRWVQPTATDISNNPELAPYGSLGNYQSLLAFEDTLRSVSGWTDNPLIQMGHSYNGSGYTLDSYGTQMMNRYPAMVCNFKPPGGPTVANAQTTANGGHDSQIQALINSIPAGKRVYMVLLHEPDFTTAADVAVWRAALAHWSKYIIDHRGGKDLHPTICLTTWSFRPANATVQARYLQVTDDLEAAGVDWPTQVVMGPDGYQDKAAGTTAAQTFANVFPSLYAAGWRRFGLSEFAAGDKIGAIGNSTTTAADVANADDWFKSVVTWVGGAPYNAEYLCWFAPTGSKGPIGDWMYSTALRKAFADAAHFRGPAPGW